ncbi:MAG: large conductance mechanosensitive channel protein MscL [Acidimicrobiia bacterium]|nr:large conductance mechanosensitive channel protein MscL [Acidimicrobiia bacterium]
MVAEFKEFISQGDVVDLAVAVVIGAAFAAIVKSFVDDILMQVIAAIGGQPDFSSLTINIGKGTIRYGSFLNAVIGFVIIAAAIFLVVKGVNKIREFRKKEVEAGDADPTELDVLEEIRDLLKENAGA